MHAAYHARSSSQYTRTRCPSQWNPCSKLSMPWCRPGRMRARNSAVHAPMSFFTRLHTELFSPCTSRAYDSTRSTSSRTCCGVLYPYRAACPFPRFSSFCAMVPRSNGALCFPGFRTSLRNAGVDSSRPSAALERATALTIAAHSPSGSVGLGAGSDASAIERCMNLSTSSETRPATSALQPCSLLVLLGLLGLFWVLCMGWLLSALSPRSSFSSAAAPLATRFRFPACPSLLSPASADRRFRSRPFMICTCRRCTPCSRSPSSYTTSHVPSS
mmetsp:Transcript_13778/g.32419  ORF Transcript_13778/g.32419 Transcript_13778/m.32419 type:complete len:273 (-) Transcript_13778:51-869(-)